jgi:hypothetical protein
VTDPTRPGRQPITVRSWFVRRPGRPYTEVAGHSVVVVPERRVAYEIAPAALRLWATLAHRPLGDLIADLDPDRAPVEYLELVRRWRALGLVEERAVLDGDPTSLGPEQEPEPLPELTWRAVGSRGPAPPTDDDPLAWFEALLGWVAEADLHRPGMADALATMAEQPEARAALAARLCGPRG